MTSYSVKKGDCLTVQLVSTWTTPSCDAFRLSLQVAVSLDASLAGPQSWRSARLRKEPWNLPMEMFTTIVEVDGSNVPRVFANRRHSAVSRPC